MNGLVRRCLARQHLLRGKDGAVLHDAAPTLPVSVPSCEISIFAPTSRGWSRAGQ